MGEHITRDMCFPGGLTQITRDMCFPRWKAEWETLWKMEFHPDKCEVLREGRKRVMVQNDCILHGKTLATADSAKYLGVTIASDLRHRHHHK